MCVSVCVAILLIHHHHPQHQSISRTAQINDILSGCDKCHTRECIGSDPLDTSSLALPPLFLPVQHLGKASPHSVPVFVAEQER